MHFFKIQQSAFRYKTSLQAQFILKSFVDFCLFFQEQHIVSVQRGVQICISVTLKKKKNSDKSSDKAHKNNTT